MTYDVIIIGGGPAGAAAAIYAARKQLTTLLVLKEWGGQSNVSSDIQNWIGTPSISGMDFAKMLKSHVEAHTGDFLTVQENHWVTNIAKQNDNTFTVTTDKDTFTTRTVLITTGSSRKKLSVPGAEEFENKGVVYCASCDGPLFSGQNVAVIGGGNAGFESAAQLLAYCPSVHILSHGNAFRADEITQEKVLAHENAHAVLNAEIIEVQGDGPFVSGLVYRDKTTNETHTLPVTGVFVEIGLIPNTDFAKEVVATDELGRITIDPWTGATSVSGIWAAGDCTNVKYHQNNIAAGDAVRALEDLYLHIKMRA